MTNHDWARKQIGFYTNSVNFDIEQMKHHREIIKKEIAFIKEAQKEGYTFTTTKEKEDAERWYRYYYNQKKHDEKMIAKYYKELADFEVILY